MALYAIGDLHLSLGADKPMDVFGGRWENYIEKIREGFSILCPEDVCVLCGDLSWAMSLEASLADFRFLAGLPGRKILLKGNHDYWWNTAAKLNGFFEKNRLGDFRILHNCAFDCGEEYAVCGTRGWFYEEEKGTAHDRKILLRELGRLETSLKAAGDRQKLVFLHYPPVYGDYRCEEILALLEKYDVRLCCSGHIHGKGLAQIFQGRLGRTEFMTVSADYLSFKPRKILENELHLKELSVIIP